MNRADKPNTKWVLLCPICHKNMTVGRVGDDLVGCCENEKCLSTFVFGKPVTTSLTSLEDK